MRKNVSFTVTLETELFNLLADNNFRNCEEKLENKILVKQNIDLAVKYIKKCSKYI